MSNDKLHNLDDSNDALKILRLILSIKKNPTVLQQRRPHLLIEKLSFENINDQVKKNAFSKFNLGWHFENYGFSSRNTIKCRQFNTYSRMGRFSFECC